MGYKRVPPDVKAAVLDAIRNRRGRSRAAIAREFGVGTRTVQRIADDAGIVNPWETEGTREATTAARDHLRARRAAISAKFLDEADSLLDKLHEPYIAFAFGGKDNTYAEHRLPGPPAGEIRNIMTSAAVAFDKHLAADKHDAGDETDGMVSMLGKLADGLDAAHKRLSTDPGERGPVDEPPGEPDAEPDAEQ